MEEISQPREIPIPPASQTPISNEPTGKKGPAIFVAVLVLLLIGGVVFYFGLKSRNSSEEPSPTPTTSTTTSTPTPTEEADKSPTPTKKPSVTPTPKPTATTTPTPTIASQSMTITSTASLDGWRSSNGGGNTTWYIEIGRNGTLTSRGFVSFDLSSIPSGKTIDEATLRLYQVEVVGTPYSSIGSLIVDHLNYGDSLGSDDLTVSAISSNVGTLTSSASVEWKDLIVTNSLKADISASRTRSQYRLRFSTEATGADAWARFESADNYKGTGNLPQLVVKYH